MNDLSELPAPKVKITVTQLHFKGRKKHCLDLINFTFCSVTTTAILVSHLNLRNSHRDITSGETCVPF